MLTFLFTDIEGSTHLVQELKSTYGLTLRVHRQVLRTCASDQGGKDLDSVGDGLFVVFTDAEAAVRCCVAAQRKLEHYPWPDGLRLRVRMGMHTGPTVLSGGEYVGLTVHEAARIAASAHGGQILCSSATAEAARDVGEGIEFRELGSYHLRGIDEPQLVLQVCAPDLEQDFPPIREAVREGGTRVSIWRRGDGVEGAGREDPIDAADVTLAGLDGDALPPNVKVDIRRGSNGSFRLIVSSDGVVEEEFDGLTHQGAASIVNAHSRFVRVGP